MKLISGITLVAATCIGSGMIALPITLAKIGIIPSIVVMLAMWLIIYYTALASVELNLQAGRGMSLGPLCKNFSGRKMQYFGGTLLKLLSYSLLSAYIAGGSSVLEKIIGIDNLNIWYIIGLLTILLMPSGIVKQVNNFLFLALLCITGLLIIFLVYSVSWDKIPLVEVEKISQVNVWSTLIPVVFTSFGFQVIFHTLTDYYKSDAAALKKVFFWGSLIPSLVYILWTCSILGAINNHSQEFYNKMVSSDIDVGELVTQLSLIADNDMIQIIVRWIALLAIITSAIGVGLGLVGTVSEQLEGISDSYKQSSFKKIISVTLTIVPAGAIVILIPDAFISILGFAGMILSFIAILIPIYLLQNVKGTLFYSELRNKTMIIISALVGVLIILCGIYNML